MKAPARVTTLARIAWLLTASCATQQDDTADAGDAQAATMSEAGCTSNADCDDGVMCTVDLCVIGGTCMHTPMGSGCVVPRTCMSQAECDDHVECTLDQCLVGGRCGNQTRDDQCPAGQTCDRQLGCVPPGGIRDSGATDPDVPAAMNDVPMRDVPAATDAGMPMDAVTPRDATTADAGPSADAVVADTPRTDTGPIDAGTGGFRLTPPVSYGCFDDLEMSQALSVNAASVTLTITASSMTATWPGAPATLTGPAPSGGAFRLTGYHAQPDCPATLVLSGTFSDASHFTGALDLQFHGEFCVVTTCEDQHFVVSGALTP